MPSASESPRDSSRRRSERRRRTHHRTDSNGELLGERETPPSSPSKSRPKQSRHHSDRHRRPPESENSRTTSSGFTSDQLAALDKLNQKLGWNEQEGVQRRRERHEDADAREDHRARRERRRDEREPKRERNREYSQGHEQRRDRERDREYSRGQDRRRDRENERESEEREIERRRRREEHRERRRRRREEERAAETAATVEAVDAEERDDGTYDRPKPQRYRSRNGQRVASGQAVERGTQAYYSDKEEYRDDIRQMDGSSGDGSYVLVDEEHRKKKIRRNIFIGVGVLIVLLAIIIPVAVVVSKKKSSGSDGGASNSTSPANGNLNGVDPSSIPAWAKGTYLDPFDWYDTEDFNLTFTNATVGGLYVMGLNSTWSDDTQANSNVPALNETWQYGTMPIRGINLGGWLSIEPFITPSLFSKYSSHDNVVDEWTLCQKLGSQAKSTIEQHYSSFVQESTFADIQAAGFDHVRIPFSYWAVTTYDGDPYVPLISWRYLLRAIEWARKYGLRINLDLHGAPGSQNGWNHSGHQGQIGWLNGTDGALNGNRTIEIHKQLSTFFTQPRYKNIIALYGLVNEPRMVVLDTDTVLAWSASAIEAIQGNNFTGILVFGDGFMGLNNWQGKLQGYKNLLLDAHQYVIFNVAQIVLDHTDKINFACSGWTAQTQQSQNTATGFGPTLTGEWSQADTDCAQYLNNVGVGSRWEGTLNMASTPGGGDESSVLAPTCPTHNNPACSCTDANADPSTYSSQYKQWLLMFAEAQMYSFEQGWGWFYWTWQTETATQWSYKAGLAAGILPKLAYQRDFNCANGSIPDYGTSGLPEYY